MHIYIYIYIYIYSYIHKQEKTGSRVKLCSSADPYVGGSEDPGRIITITIFIIIIRC